MSTDIYWMIMVGIIGFLMVKEVIRFRKEKDKIKMLKEFEQFLGELRHHYYIHGMISEAIYEVLPTLDGKIEKKIEWIYEIIEAKEMEEEIEQFHRTESSRFLRTFLALCAALIQYGDKEVNGQSLFLTNTKNLKQEIGIEILKWQKINYLFSGFMFLILVPGLSLKMIENWGIWNLPELDAYYKGSFGFISILVLMAVIILSYSLINELRENEEVVSKEHPVLKWFENLPILSTFLIAVTEKNYGKYLQKQELLRKVGETMTPRQLIVKQILFFAATILTGMILLLSFHANNRYQIINRTSNLTNHSSAISKAQLDQLKDVTVSYSSRYKNKGITKQQLMDDMIREEVVLNKQLMTLTADEIISRIDVYKKEKVRWYEICISILAGCFAGQIPLLQLYYKKKVRQMGMEDEVMQFHSIILMLMYMDRIAVDIILEWMEQFAKIFQLSISECINDFSSGEDEALYHLKQKEPFLPFARIVENLIICDKIGIEKAFDEIAVERANYQEKRKQENEIYISTKALWGKLIAYIPLISVIGLYLILPFVVESISQLAQFMIQIQGM